MLAIIIARFVRSCPPAEVAKVEVAQALGIPTWCAVNGRRRIIVNGVSSMELLRSMGSQRVASMRLLWSLLLSIPESRCRRFG